MLDLVDDLYQQGLKLHKSGKVELAYRVYTLVLNANPEHSMANHNMGALAVDNGKVQEALPFFEAALEANADVAQFWVSYIDALINVERIADAQAVFHQAKNNGAKGVGFDQLETRLNEAYKELLEASKIASEPTPKKPNILDSLKLDQAISLAKKKVKESDPGEAKRIYQDILWKFPKNKRASDGLKVLAGKSVGKSSKAEDAQNDELQSLIDLYNNGQLALVVEQAQILTKQYPKAFDVWNLMGISAAQIGQLDQAIFAFRKVLAIKPNVAEAFNNIGNALKEQGKLEEAIEAYNKALAIKPNYADAYYNIGDALKEQGKLEEAIGAYNKALAIKPYDAVAYNNMGIILKEQGKLEEAIEAYSKALSLKPDYAEAYTNMGNALTDQGKLEEAIEAYNKALAIQPDYADAYYNIGVTLQEQGKLEEAIEAYNKALAIKPDYAEAVENSQSIAVQLLPIIANYGYDFDTSEEQASSEIVHRPKYQIQNAIKAYLAGDFGQAYSHNNNFKACDQNLLVRLNPKDKVFCSAYNSFIGKLLDANWDEELACENKVYHLGESHCLSYAHRNIAIGGSNFRIVPRITFGAKAFHFCRTKYDRFKAITKAHLMSLPKNSKVFLSYGEIDCRPNEGFISAARKLDKPLEELIDQTTEGYVQWFLDQNADQRQRLYFINVPAPVYYKEHSADLNSEVARTVALFNTALKKYSLQHDFDVVDVFNFTVGKEGFSNGLFHIDNHHLGAQALVEINRQLS
ncbi:tetratricopeptide repeat protein [bacterium]|nr:tetratricopeptide repeat protein [bacterium]